VIIGIALGDLTRQPFKAGVQAQQDGEVVRISGVIHNVDSFRECANFMRHAMSRIQSIARFNLVGGHPVSSAALAT
jgi:hypothetical protein